MKKQWIHWVGIFFLSSALAQPQTFTIAEAVNAAISNNGWYKADQYHVNHAMALKRTATDLGKTSIMWMHGQYNSILQDNSFTVTQSIPFPTAMASQGKLLRAQAGLAESELAISKTNLIADTKTAYVNLAHAQALSVLLEAQDSLFRLFSRATSLRYQSGEGTLLEKTTADTQSMQIRNQWAQNQSDREIALRQLQLLISHSDAILTENHIKLEKPENLNALSSPQVNFAASQVGLAKGARSVEQNKILPDFNVGFFAQSLTGFQLIDNQDVFFDRSKLFTGFQLGISFPLWFGPHAARVKSYNWQQQAAEQRLEYSLQQTNAQVEQAIQSIDKFEASLEYYEKYALQNADLITAQARKSFSSGEIGYLEFLNAWKNVFEIRLGYEQTLLQYNLAVIQLERTLGYE